MQQKSTKVFIIPLISLSIFMILIFGAAYAFYIANTSMNVANYQVVLPKATSLVCTKTDCGVTLTPAQMSTINTNSTTAAASSNCYVNCTCSGSAGATCNYNVFLIEKGMTYTPSSGLGTQNEFTAKLNLTQASGCSAQNSSTSETQVNTIRGKKVSACSLSISSGTSVSANIGVEFKWYNLNIDQASQAGKQYSYQLTTSSELYTVTFDANGGTVGTPSKTVIYGGEYGELPTPTWEGHTFRGWNGKNMLNLTDVNKTLNGVTITCHNNLIHVYGTNEKTDAAYGIYTWNNLNPTFVVGQTYTLSLYQTTTNVYFQLNYKKTDNANSSMASTSGPTQTFTVPSNFNYFLYPFVGIRKTAGVLDYTYYVQLEEGSQSTPFEPYFIESDTIVVQQQNHTLKAIWD